MFITNPELVELQIGMRLCDRLDFLANHELFSSLNGQIFSKTHLLNLYKTFGINVGVERDSKNVGLSNVAVNGLDINNIKE